MCASQPALTPPFELCLGLSFSFASALYAGGLFWAIMGCCCSRSEKRRKRAESGDDAEEGNMGSGHSSSKKSKNSASPLSDEASAREALQRVPKGFVPVKASRKFRVLRF